MIKGVQKNIIIIKDTNSEIFEQAIFIIKRGTPQLSDHTLKKEAERIIELKTSNYLKNAIRKKSIFTKFFEEN